jgi:histidine ammonia-lyase
MTIKNIVLDGISLSFNTIAEVAYGDSKLIKISIDKSAREKMKSSNEYVNKIAREDNAVYGINTGFGALSNKKIDEHDLEELQYNLIRSHCTGLGNPFKQGITRAIMLLRANCLIQGYSGVTPEIVDLILDFLNYNIIPVIPEKGSVGASGDLAPLAHMALALIGEGEVIYNNKLVRSSFAIEDIGKTCAKLGPKDGLALINGTAVMTALGACAIFQASEIMKIADISAAMTLDGVLGTTKAYDPRITKLKPHPGQTQVCENLNILLKESNLINSHENCGKVQDPYSLRCVPQVHGACRQTLEHAKQVFQIEINSVTDNPLIFVRDEEVLSGGNFHGEAIAFAMDYLAIGVSEICNISERRIEKMMNPTFSSLPSFLINNSGLNSGLMIAHVTAAALASENKYLSHPASVDSIPTSTDKEDHVSMGVTSGRKLLEVLQNTKDCLAIELLCNTQALSFQLPNTSSPVLNSVYNLIRRHVPVIEKDRVFSHDINTISGLIENGDLIKEVISHTGELK